MFYDAALCSCKAAPAHSFALLGAGKVAGVRVKYYIVKINVVYLLVQLAVYMCVR